MWFALRKESLDFIRTAPVLHVCAAAVAAPRAVVFGAFADAANWSRWFPNVRVASYTSAPPHGVGSIRGARVGGTRWSEEMIAWDVDARLAWTVTRTSVPFAVAQVESFEFTDATNGTEVRWTLAIAPRLVARLGGPFTQRAMTRMLHRATRNLEAYLQQIDGDSRQGKEQAR